MTSRRVIPGVLHNFLGTFTSRYSDFDGYWVFGFLIESMDRVRIDLLSEAAKSEVVFIGGFTGLSPSIRPAPGSTLPGRLDFGRQGVGRRRLDALHGETRRNILESRDFQQFFIEFITFFLSNEFIDYFLFYFIFDFFSCVFSSEIKIF